LSSDTSYSTVINEHEFDPLTQCCKKCHVPLRGVVEFGIHCSQPTITEKEE